MTTAYAPRRPHRFPAPACSCGCPAAHRTHHDRLLTVDVDMDELLALLEMAVTWYELDYSDSPVVPPAAWARFAESHDWTFPERAERAFGMAVDIVERSAAPGEPEPSLAAVLEFVRR